MPSQSEGVTLFVKRRFVIGSTTRSVSSNGIRFLGPNEFNILCGRQMVTGFLTPSSVPSRRPCNNSTRELYLLRNVLCIKEITTNEGTCRGVAFHSRNYYLPFRSTIRTVVVTSYNRSKDINYRNSNKRTFPFNRRASSRFNDSVLNVNYATTIATGRSFIPLSGNLCCRVTSNFSINGRLPIIRSVFFRPSAFLSKLSSVVLRGFLVSLMRECSVSRVGLTFSRVFGLSLLSPFRSTRRDRRCTFFGVRSSLLNV